MAPKERNIIVVMNSGESSLNNPYRAKVIAIVEKRILTLNSMKFTPDSEDKTMVTFISMIINGFE